MNVEIIVAEDEKSQREMLRDELTTKGFSVTSAENGQEALKQIQTKSFDLLITDLQMPKMDGAQLVFRARKTHPDLQIIVLTGYLEGETIIDLLNMGVNGLVKKPFELSDLFNKIENALNKKRIEETLHQMSKMAALGELTPSVAHELRNAFSQISMATRYLNQSTSRFSKKQLKYLKVVTDGTNRANHTIDHLLTFSRYAGRKKLVNLGDLFANLLNLVEDRLKLHSIKVDLMVGNLEVITDPDSLKIIFINLIINALHAIGDEGTLTIKASRGKEDLSISVNDTGHGMSPKLLNRVFDNFFTTKGDNGTGLGLATVKREIEKLNGKTEVVSKVNAGTTFTIILPLNTTGTNVPVKI